MRKMGLDIGDKKIGIALSDTLKVSAHSQETLRRTDHQQDLKTIKKYIEKDDVDEVIVGLPKNMNGTLGPQAKKTKQYINFLKNNLKIPVKIWDERLSSREAEKILIEADLSREKRKKVIDGVAASLILQGYLDFKNNQKRQPVKEDLNGK